MVRARYDGEQFERCGHDCCRQSFFFFRKSGGEGGGGRRVTTYTTKHIWHTHIHTHKDLHIYIHMHTIQNSYGVDTLQYYIVHCSRCSVVQRCSEA